LFDLFLFLVVEHVVQAATSNRHDRLGLPIIRICATP